MTDPEADRTGGLQVAKLAGLNGATIDESKPFAELWCVWQNLAYPCSRGGAQPGTATPLAARPSPPHTIRTASLDSQPPLAAPPPPCRMGTHPSGPATLASDPEQTLKAWIQANPAALGDKVLKRFGVDLPYLFKVRDSSSSWQQQSAAAAVALSSGAERPRQPLA